MNNLVISGLVFLGGCIVYIAERQQEISIVSAILENKGVDTSKNQIRKKLNISPFYRLSTACLGLAFLIFVALVSDLPATSDWILGSANALLIVLGAAGCVLRAIALIRIVNEEK